MIFQHQVNGTQSQQNKILLKLYYQTCQVQNSGDSSDQCRTLTYFCTVLNRYGCPNICEDKVCKKTLDQAGKSILSQSKYSKLLNKFGTAPNYGLTEVHTRYMYQYAQKNSE